MIEFVHTKDRALKIKQVILSFYRWCCTDAGFSILLIAGFILSGVTLSYYFHLFFGGCFAVMSFFLTIALRLQYAGFSGNTEVKPVIGKEQKLGMWKKRDKILYERYYSTHCNRVLKSLYCLEDKFISREKQNDRNKILVNW